MSEEITPKKEFRDQVFDLIEEYDTFHAGAFIPEKYGLCSRCKELRWATGAYGKELAECSYESMMRWPILLMPMSKCSVFGERGKLSLNEMSNMATYITNKDRVVGFAANREEDE